MVDHPGQRDLRRCGAVGRRHLPQGGQQLATSLDVLGEEQGVAGPHPARPVLPVVPGGEEPLGQRAVGDDQAVLLLSERQ